MSLNLNIMVMAIAVLVMLYALKGVFALKKELPGGMIGKNITYLAGLVGFFAVGYIFVPLLGKLSQDAMELIVALLLMFGAIYVVVTINLIGNIVKVLSE